jgi:hypothetical protein
MNNHSESTEAYIGYYSEKQHTILKEHNNRPYIYYKNCNGKIVQVTEVKQVKNGTSLFQDAVSMGGIDTFIHASKEPVYQEVVNRFDTSNACFR